MALIRALTIFYDYRETPRESSTHEYLTSLLNKLYDYIESKGLKRSIWSIRLALPVSQTKEELIRAYNIASKVLETHPEILVAALHIDNLAKLQDDFMKLFMDYPLYGSVLVKKHDEAVAAAEFLLKLSYQAPEAATRMAIALGERLLTPYFPLASQIRRGQGLGIAMLYPNDLLRAKNMRDIKSIISKICMEADSVGRGISLSISIDWYGTDLSLSPWMDNSVGEVLERLSSKKIGDLEIMETIYLLNKTIEDIVISKYGYRTSTGFNEVMLPVAEDNVLKDRVLERRLTLRDLILYTMVSVAGVDMVVLPEDTPRSYLSALLTSVQYISEIKKKPLGVRVIIYPGAREGDVVELGKFGKVPVIKI